MVKRVGERESKAHDRVGKCFLGRNVNVPREEKWKVSASQVISNVESAFGFLAGLLAQKVGQILVVLVPN